jgi:hypothetical protein
MTTTVIVSMHGKIFIIIIQDFISEVRRVGVIIGVVFESGCP